MPELIALLPWKKRIGWLTGRLEPLKTRFATVTEVEPAPESTPPEPVELAHPSPAPPLFEQGQAVPVPSPKQKGTPTEPLEQPLEGAI